MKHTLELEVDLPLKRVIELFDSSENLKKWQPGFISFEHVSGIAGEAGAKSKLKYKMGKGELEMIETIEVRNLPEEFTATYEAKGVWNRVKNSFSEISPEKTKWDFDSDFLGTNFMMKALLFLAPWAFKKQSFKEMKFFKDFAEKEGK